MPDYMDPGMIMVMQMLYDPQASSLYTAQQHAWYPGIKDFETADRITPRDFATVDDAIAFARSIQRSDWAKRTYPKFAAEKPVEIEMVTWMDPLESGRTDLSAGMMKILLNATSNFGHSKRVLIHELAHLINAYEFGHIDTERGGYVSDSHGPLFAGVYLKLVAEYLGEDALTTLSHEFTKFHVQHQE